MAWAFVAHPGTRAGGYSARPDRRGMDELRGGRHISVPPARRVLGAIVLLDPDLTQDLDRRSPADFGRGLGGIRRLQQGKAIGPNGGGQLVTFRVGSGKPVVLTRFP